MTQDPIKREEHRKMVQAMVERERRKEGVQVLETAVNLLADKLSNSFLTQDQITKELSAMAILFKSRGATKHDWLEAVNHLEQAAGYKLIVKN